MPVIDSFVAEPAPVYAKDLPRSVALSWNVNTNGKVSLESSVGTPDPNQYDAVGGVSKPIQAPQMFTLVPVEQPDDLRIRRIEGGHFVPWEQPKTVARAIRDFMHEVRTA